LFFGTNFAPLKFTKPWIKFQRHDIGSNKTRKDRIKMLPFATENVGGIDR